MENENPWLTMWCNPRSTIRRIVETNPNQSLWLLAFIYGFTVLLNGFQSYPIAIQIGIWPMFGLALILAPFWGYLLFSIWSWAVVVTGKLLQGKATFVTARAAYAWSCIPLLCNVALWLILILFFSPILFFGPQPHLVMTGPTITLLFLLLIGKVVFSIWSIVLYLQALAQVQFFSVLRSIGNVILAAIFLALLVAVPICLFALLVGGCTNHAASLWGIGIPFIQ